MENERLGSDAAALLRQIADNPELIQAAHLAVEDHLVELRDSRMMISGPHGFPANGFAIRERDGSPSEIIRLGTRPGIVLALKAIADRIETDSREGSR